MRQLSVRCGCEVASSCVEASPLIMAFNASQIFLDAFLSRFRTHVATFRGNAQQQVPHQLSLLNNNKNK
jgi:hypothetical protein